MKRKILLVISIMFIFSMVLSSCQKQESDLSVNHAKSQTTTPESSSTSPVVTPTKFSPDKIMKANTPSQLYSTWQANEINFFNTGDCQIKLSQILKNDTILYGYYQGKDNSTVHFGVYNINQNKFITLNYKINTNNQNDSVCFVQETQNSYYIAHDDTVDVLNKNFTKTNDFSCDNDYSQNVVTSNDKYALTTNCDTNGAQQVYLIDIAKHSSKIIYTFNPPKNDGEYTMSAYFINDTDVLVKTGPVGFNGPDGVIIDINGNFVHEFMSSSNITFNYENRYICYRGWTDAFLSQGELGIYDLNSFSYTPMIKSPNMTYGMLDLNRNDLLYAQCNDDPKITDPNANVVSLLMYNIATKTKTALLQNFTNFDGFEAYQGQCAISQDGTSVYYLYTYFIDDNSDTLSQISYVFTKKIA